MLAAARIARRCNHLDVSPQELPFHNSALRTYAEALIADGGVIGIQVLNEFTNVARRKLRWVGNRLKRHLRSLRSTIRCQRNRISKLLIGRRLSVRDTTSETCRPGVGLRTAAAKAQRPAG